jgi:hypothetical protein
LEGEIAKVLFVSAANEDFESDRIAAALRAEFGTAHGDETGFQSGDAEETPFGVGHSLHEVTFVAGGWGELLGRDELAANRAAAHRGNAPFH